jgi:hypothetical protein
MFILKTVIRQLADALIFKMNKLPILEDRLVLGVLLLGTPKNR